MRKLLVLIFGLMLMGTYAEATQLDAPHNGSRAIACADCHTFTAPLDDNICLGCHTNATGGGYSKNSAPKVATHSSANTSTKYGAWTIMCVDCHYQHTHMQAVTYGAAAYLITGAISSVTDNGDSTTTFGYTGASILNTNYTDFNKWGKKTSNERGLIMFPNLTDTTTSFEILSATANTITVKGSVNTAFPGKVAAGNSFALIYGQYVNVNISTPDPNNMTQDPSLPLNKGIKVAKFFDNTGPSSFAHNDKLGGDINGDGIPDDSTPDGVCQVCHTRTSYWRSDGTLAAVGIHSNLNGVNCTSACHPHKDGFSPKGACNTCHGYPPTDNTSGGPTGLVSSEGGTGSTSPGAHSKHATSAGMNYNCEKCHTGGMPASAIYDKILEIGFSLPDGSVTGSYDGATLANGFSYAAGNAGTAITTGGSRSCSSIYCHGATMAPNGGTNNTPVWTDATTAACGTCHGATAANPPLRGSHQKHAGDRQIACTTCHSDYQSAKKHVNGSADWSFDSTTYPWLSTAQYRGAGSGTTTPVPSASYGQCSNLYCHSIVQTAAGGPLTGAAGEYKTPTWGDKWDRSTAAVCDNCHGRKPGSGSHPRHTGGGVGQYTLHCGQCHYDNTCANCHSFGTGGMTFTMSSPLHANHETNVSSPLNWGGSYSGTPQPGDGFGSCSNVYCHSNAQSNTAPFAAPNIAPTWGSSLNTTCTGCHNGDRNANVQMASGSHTKHVGGGIDCSRCHNQTVSNSRTIANPLNHVNRLIDIAFDATANPTSTATYNGTTSPVAKTPGTAYGSCSNIYCHFSATPTWGSSLPADCTGCHGNNASSATPIASGTHTKHMNNAGFLGTNFACAQCHNATVSAGSDRTVTGTVHANGTKDVVFLNGGSYDSTGKACANTYCHSNGKGVSQNPPAWGSGTALACNGCHGTSTTTGAPDYANGGKGTATANSHPKHTKAGSATCDSCHTGTTNTGTAIAAGSLLHINGTRDLTFNPARAGGAAFDPTTKTCSNIACHFNGTAQWGDSLNCNSCHAFPPSTGAHATHIQDASLLTMAYGNTEVKSTPASYAFGCGNCHPTDPAMHANGTVDVVLNPADGGALKSKNAATASRSGSGATTVCNQIYCHSNGAGGANSNMAAAASPQWGGSLGANRCGGCHGNPPQYASAGAGVDGANSHYSANGFMGKEGGHMITIHRDNIFDKVNGAGLLSTGAIDGSHGDPNVTITIACYVCHSATVSSTVIDTYAMDSTTSSFRCGACHTSSTPTKLQIGQIADKSMHVNGSRNVVFAAVSMKSKAQLKDASMPAGWTRNGAYGYSGSYDSSSAALNTGSFTPATKTCTVACHNNNSIKWGDNTNTTCSSCHKEL